MKNFRIHYHPPPPRSSAPKKRKTEPIRELSLPNSVKSFPVIEPTFVLDIPLGFPSSLSRNMWTSVDNRYILILLKEKNFGTQLKIHNAATGAKVNCCTFNGEDQVIFCKVFPGPKKKETLVACLCRGNRKQLRFFNLVNLCTGDPPEFVLNFEEDLRDVLITKSGRFLVVFPCNSNRVTIFDLHRSGRNKKKWTLLVPRLCTRVFVADNNLVAFPVASPYLQLEEFSYKVYNLESEKEQLQPILHSFKEIPLYGCKLKVSKDGKVLCFRINLHKKEKFRTINVFCETLNPSKEFAKFVATSPVFSFWSDMKNVCTWVSTKDRQIYSLDFKNPGRILKQEKLSHNFGSSSKFLTAGDLENMLICEITDKNFIFYNVSKHRKEKFNAKIKKILHRDFLHKSSLKKIICDEVIKAI